MDQHDTDRHDFASAGIAARVSADGAELHGLRDHTGHDYLWPAGPAWPRHAPVLFPIVGRLAGDSLTHAGRTYRMTQHGFARDRRFTWVDKSTTGCRLRLTDDAQTRAMYPFGFQFEVAYAVADATLSVTFTVTNTGDEVLPASMGSHPAFRWPLVPGEPKDSYTLVFDASETAPVPHLDGGLLTEANRPSPIAGRSLPMTEALFADDAVILPNPASRSVRYAAASGPALTVAWEGFEQLGLWSRVGSDFVCIEPWRGMSSPVGFSGDFMDKPWLMLIPPGESRSAIHRITVEA